MIHVSFSYSVFKKSSNNGCSDTKNYHNAGEKKEEKGLMKEISFKVNLSCDRFSTKLLKEITRFDEIETLSMDRTKGLVTVRSTMNFVALIDYLRIVLNEGEYGDDSDNNGGGGGKSKNKDDSGDGDGSGDGGDKAEGSEKWNGMGMDYMGQPWCGYRYGYHAGDENGYPVGQLHAAKIQVY